MKRTAYALAVFVCLAASAAYADVIVDPGTWVLPKGAGQEISFSISGGSQIQWTTLLTQITGTAPMPVITSGTIQGDATHPVIYYGHTLGQSDNIGQNPQQLTLDVITSGAAGSVTVTGTGTLAYLTIDTSGAAYGTYALSLAGSDIGSGAGVGNVTLLPGSITVVPEPGTLALLAAGLMGLLVYAWRKRS